MTLPVRVLKDGHFSALGGDPHLGEEWLVTNGLGGYASGTVEGELTRRYHGLLIAALPNPLGRTMMLDALSERIRLPNREFFLMGTAELSGIPRQQAMQPLEFRLEGGIPVWRFERAGCVVEKRLFMAYRQNTVYVSWKLLEGPEHIRLGLRPGIHFRAHDASVSEDLSENYIMTISDEGYEICADKTPYPPLRMTCGPEGAFTADRTAIRGICYRTELKRGYPSDGALWSPGYFRFDLERGQEATFTASCEKWEVLRALTPAQALEAEITRRTVLICNAEPSAREGPPAELVLAADQFLIDPEGRTEDTAQAHAAGQELRTIIAGYHWFTDWGRDTMISLEGLTLVTGRRDEAGWILHTFARYIRDGLIPNLFPEGQQDGLYHTADATMWFFHAVSRYLSYSNDRITLRLLLPKFIDIIDHHLRGTRFGIGVDPADSLLRQGQEGYQLTWMDAKVGDWVVTPRRGKAVEINALWYNALRLLAGWVEQEQGSANAARYKNLADKVEESFNRRFWYDNGKYLYDVIDGVKGDDPAIRPNQVFAISLPNPVLDKSRWLSVMDVVEKQLLTPVGLRSLAPTDPDYQTKYDGDLRARDAAYHQGTVWAWLIGPFIDAWLKVHPGRTSEASEFLKGFVPHLDQACVGSISEVFDAEIPHTPRACIAQAWSVAEVLRCWAMLGEKKDPDDTTDDCK